MKTQALFLSALGLLSAAFAFADQPPEPPVPVVQAPPRPSTTSLPDNQQLYGGGQAPLVTPEMAKALVDKFRAAFAVEAGPRFVFYVNRELVDAASGLQLTQRTEQTEAERSETANGPAAPASPAQSEKISAQNTYEAKDAAAPTLADRQTVRDVERLFGRPFRAAGCRLADQKVAASLLADKPFSTFSAVGGDQARRDREALANVADIAVEVLVSSRNVTIPTISGYEVVTVPDIQATAIRLKDSAIIGQASSSDILGKDPQAAHLAKRYDVRDITEAMSLALMQDMLTGAK